MTACQKIKTIDYATNGKCGKAFSDVANSPDCGILTLKVRPKHVGYCSQSATSDMLFLWEYVKMTYRVREDKCSHALLHAMEIDQTGSKILSDASHNKAITTGVVGTALSNIKGFNCSVQPLLFGPRL